MKLQVLVYDELKAYALKEARYRLLREMASSPQIQEDVDRGAGRFTDYRHFIVCSRYLLPEREEVGKVVVFDGPQAHMNHANLENASSGAWIELGFGKEGRKILGGGIAEIRDDLVVLGGTSGDYGDFRPHLDVQEREKLESLLGFPVRIL